MSVKVGSQTKIEVVAAVAESPFYIPMTGPASRPRRGLKHNHTNNDLDSHRDNGASSGGPEGVFK